ncbi:MAG: hypothetical protein AAF587_04335 [Bacteroidota bacterium]
MKKKLIFTIAILSICCCSSLFAQKSPEEPTIYLKAGQSYLQLSDLSFNWNGGVTFPDHIALNQAFPSGSYDMMNLGLKLGYGYMLSNQWMLGARLGYKGDFRWEEGGDFLGAGHGWNTNLFARYYVTRGRFNPFIEGGIGAESFAEIGQGLPIAITSTYQEIKFGMQYHVNKRLSLELSNAIRHTSFQDLAPGFGAPVKRHIGILNPTLGLNIRL